VETGRFQGHRYALPMAGNAQVAGQR